jgi:putative two-component system response regulator
MKKVLIVDDDPIALDLLEKALSGEGYDVLRAHDGREALDILQACDCRMVISDWEMPEINGLELCRRIRTDNTDVYTYVILVTGHDNPDDSVTGLAAGADDFLQKPFRVPELIARVRSGERVISLETRDLAIFAMAKLAESRDPETGAHLDRVRSYCHALATHLNQHPVLGQIVTQEFVQLIYNTSPLHDIGKVAIPDCVLLKPGRLTDREFAIMKTHTTAGAATLTEALREFPNAGFLQMARDIALSHHERYDGTGYPHGLRGDAVPMAARIVALADVYDALTSKRVYKDEFDHDVARAMIIEERGTQFDPCVIDAFIAIESTFLEIRNRFRDVTYTAA